MKKFLIASTFLVSVNACALSTQVTQWNAVVSATPQASEYATIAQALSAAPTQGTPWRILIKDARWVERLVIDRPVTLIGQSREKTIIEASTPAGALDGNGNKLGTSRTSTVEVRANGVTMENLTIRNSFDFPANRALPDGAPHKLKDTQAVALMIADNVDQARFRRVKLEGYQDTFYSKNGSRSYFTDCIVTGHVDFIFGAGIAVFDGCDIIARNRTDVSSPLGYITAPSTSSTAKYGLIFIKSKISKEAEVPARSFALGRPWHPTTQFSDGRYADPNAIGLAAFINCDIDEHIYGWDKMSGKNKAGEKTWFYPQDSRFYEFSNSGAGAGQGGKHHQLSAIDAAHYNIETIFSGWQPELLN